MTRNNINKYIPHEVVGIQLTQDCNLISAWRQYKNLSLQQLANLSGIERSTLAEVEQNNSEDINVLKSLAVALGVDVSQL